MSVTIGCLEEPQSEKDGTSEVDEVQEVDSRPSKQPSPELHTDPDKTIASSPTPPRGSGQRVLRTPSSTSSRKQRQSENGKSSREVVDEARDSLASEDASMEHDSATEGTGDESADPGQKRQPNESPTTDVSEDSRRAAASPAADSRKRRRRSSLDRTEVDEGTSVHESTSAQEARRTSKETPKKRRDPAKEEVEATQKAQPPIMRRPPTTGAPSRAKRGGKKGLQWSNFG